MSDDPYPAPAIQDVAAPVEAMTDGEAIRKKHLKHEAALKVIGSLYLMGAVLGIVLLLGLFAGAETLGARNNAKAYWMTAGGIFAVIVTQFSAGWGLRKLRPWAKIPAGLLAVISLTLLFSGVILAEVIGTLFGVCVLYLLFCAKGRTVLSPAYESTMAQTAHLRYRMPGWIWIAVVLILLLLLGLALFSPGIR